MKYPKDQFVILTNCLKQLSTIQYLPGINESTLYFIVCTNLLSNLAHNALVKLETGEIVKLHSIPPTTTFTRLIEINDSWEIYPKGIDDTHVKTAVKAALKLIYADKECESI